ncbi:MAG: sensor histidine kinase [Xanthomonadales bacterium]|nr:sensor histidine kinase [Gammaproteobacteria bacterium]MBT8051109.1 sensor histidine kinase [Gammaproteobacteria bacterium]MBT8057846.1 sensor histidine kinase [Gammaproteobacteria bacterium]NNJ77712.1 sensor histidine kinase [Xanthomonadales bacterium]NNL04915.1 sensor histidine kinase [Xanthomonadales bacterium]
MRRRLTSRIIILSVFWVAIALVATAALLTWLYRDHIEQHYDAHVFTHVEELIADVTVRPDGQPYLYRQPTDPRFYRANSGWYWQVVIGGRILAKSDSLGDRDLDISELNFDENHDAQILLDPLGQRLRARVVHVMPQNIDEEVTIVATAPEIQIQDDVADFGWHIALAFAVLGLGLTMAVLVQVFVALRPLKAIREAIGEVHAGHIDRLPRDFPLDVQPLVSELNSLIDHNETVLKRARTQLADLAHVLNTPLTVIRNEARSIHSKQGQLILDQAHTMSGAIDHYLSRARISGQKNVMGYRTSIKSVIDDLSFAMNRIYENRDITLELCSKGDCRFRGEVQDLEEMLGNLLDNACKWATKRVEVRCGLDGDRLSIFFDDDGPGIAEEELQAVTQRGKKLDENAPGYGQGLSIVREIAELYNGHLTLGKSELGGLSAELELPAVI